MSTIAFATYRGAPDLTRDDRLVIPHLERAGVAVVPAVWDAPDVEWGAFAGVVVRSCWDYHLHAAEFAEWVEGLQRRGVPLWNPPAVIRWNMDKRYLRDLRERGAAVPPTVWLEQGEAASLADVLDSESWARAVVKPRVSATAYETWATTPGSAAADQGRLDALLARGGVMVQRFVDEVVSAGEWSLIFFGERYSHAVIKRPKPGDFRSQDDFGGSFEAASPSPDLVAQAQQIVAMAGAPLLCARVDGVAQAGRFVLMELELIEPALFLETDAAAPQRMAEAILVGLAQL